MTTDLAQVLTNSHKTNIILHVVIGFIVLISIAFVPKIGLLAGLSIPILIVIIEALLGFFTGAIYLMYNAYEDATLISWKHTELHSEDFETETNTLRNGPSLYEAFNSLAILLIFMLFLFAGTGSYILFSHETQTPVYLLEYLFHVGRAAIVVFLSFPVGLIHGRYMCRRSARLVRLIS